MTKPGMGRVPASIVLAIIGFVWPAGSVYALTGFSEDFADPSHVLQADRVSVGNGAVTIQAGANFLSEDDALLLTHLGSDADIACPAVGNGEGRSSGITHTADGGGIDGEAAVFKQAGALIAFPAPGNFDYRKGTISFWLALSNWNLDAQGHSPYYPYEQTILYLENGRRSMWLFRDWNGVMCLRFSDGIGALRSLSVNTASFQSGSWHQFIFTWNIVEDIFYISIWVDGVFLDKNELATPSPRTWNPGSAFAGFSPDLILIGAKGSGPSLRSLGIPSAPAMLDELRISGSEYSNSYYSGKAAVLSSTSFDTGVASPVWGELEWDEALPAGTDIELQVSTSDDNQNWTGWLAEDRGMVTLTFDDGFSSVATEALPRMQAYGYPGVLYAIGKQVGVGDGFLSMSQLRLLQDSGWEIGNHSYYHNSTEWSISLGKDWLLSNGFGYSAFAYPGGLFDQQTIRVLSQYATTARTLINQVQTYDTKYRVYGTAGVQTLPTVRDWIQATADRRGWLVLVFHSVGQSTCSGCNIATDAFDSILGYIQSSGVQVVTIAQALPRLGMYKNNAGEEIRAANKRYIRYRAVLHSYDGASTPILSGVRISPPARIYKKIPTLIGPEGTCSPMSWPQTTDTPIETLEIAPAIGSVSVIVTTWETAGEFRKEWTETGAIPRMSPAPEFQWCWGESGPGVPCPDSCTTVDQDVDGDVDLDDWGMLQRSDPVPMAVSTAHTIGGLEPNAYYTVSASRGSVQTGSVTVKADVSGHAAFTYDLGSSTVTFSMEQQTLAASRTAVSAGSDQAQDGSSSGRD